MTTYTNHRLVVGIVCLLMNLSGMAAAQAPQSPEAFYELVEGRQMELEEEGGGEGDPLAIRLIAPDRHSTRLENEFIDGDYNYESTGAATGTLVLTFDSVDNSTDDRIEIELTFESPTAGTVLLSSFRDGRAEEGGNLPGTFEIVDTTVPVPALPGLAALLLAALLLVSSRLRQSGSSAPRAGRG